MWLFLQLCQKKVTRGEGLAKNVVVPSTFTKKVTKGEGLVENEIVPSTFTKKITKGEGLIKNVAIPSTFTKKFTRGEGQTKNVATFAMSKSKGYKTTSNKYLKLLAGSPSKSSNNQLKCGRK